MQTHARTGWIVSGVLAIILVILLGLLLKQQYDLEHNLDYVLDRGGDKITAVRAEITETCTGESPLEQDRCQDSLERLSDILREFSDDLEYFTPTSTPTSTQSR